MNMKKIAVLAVLFTLFSPYAKAEYLSNLQVKELSKFTTIKHNAYTDSIGLNVSYDGASTQAALGITQLIMTAQAPLGTADTSFGTAGTITFTAYPTMGALCDHINTFNSAAAGGYHCTLVGFKRDDVPALMYDVTATAGTDAKAAGGYNIHIDTGGTVATDPYTMRVGITPDSTRAVTLKKCYANINVIDYLAVYGKLMKYNNVKDGVTRNDTTLIYKSVATVDDTTATIDFTSNGIGGIDFAPDEHVVVKVGNGTGTQAAANFVECIWEEK